MHNCPKCNKASRCDIEDGRSVCWCFSEPRLPQPFTAVSSSPEEGPNCLCKTCLNKAHELAQSASISAGSSVKEQTY